MIFRGSQRVDLAENSANITIIFGENMHGKTSLLNAIRWCLYGAALNRQGKAIRTQDLININALRDGDRNASVKLYLNVNNKNYELEREIQFLSNGPSERKSLRIDGRLIDGGKIEQEIESVLPEQISQFMLFDGELLRNFENLVVAEGSAQATGIKNSIEETLGIPLMRTLFEAAEIVEKEYKKKSKDQFAKNTQFQLITQKIGELDLILETLVDEQRTLRDSIQNYNAELSLLSDELHDSEQALRLIDRRKDKKTRLNDLKSRLNQAQEEMKSYASDLWLEPLRNAVVPIQKSYNEQLQAISEQERERSAKTLELLKIENSLSQSVCSTCGSSLSSEKIMSLNRELNELKDALLNFGDFNEMNFNLMTKLKSLDLCPEIICKTENYRARKENTIELDRDILDLENEIYNIDQQLKGVDEVTSVTTRSKYDAVLKEIAVAENKLNECVVKIGEAESEQKSLEKSPDFQKLTEGSDIISKLERAEEIKETLRNAIVLYRDKMRSDVEARATVTFKQLTTEPTFERLEINESYGLNLIVDGLRVNRSAGAEQIVAMSLIEALNYNGRRTGPMIMDTPVGRLDNKHRKNILGYLPKVVTQLAIFAHSGELEEDSTLIDNTMIGARYKIQRNGTFEAELIRV